MGNGWRSSRQEMGAPDAARSCTLDGSREPLSPSINLKRSYTLHYEFIILTMRTAEQEFEHACQLGRTVLEHFESHHKSHPPHFLPMARALLFYTSTRAGFGLGMEHGSGFIISRCAGAGS